MGKTQCISKPKAIDIARYPLKATGREILWIFFHYISTGKHAFHKVYSVGGRYSTVVAFALPDPADPGSIPGVPEIFSEMIFRQKLSMLPGLIDGVVA